MMSKKRTIDTDAFKANVAFIIARQDKTLSQLAAQFQVHPLVISKGKSQLRNNAETIFQDSRLKKKISDTNIQELYQKVRQLKIETG